MKLSAFIVELQKLEDAGHGDLEVLYRHGSSGDCGELSYGHVSDHRDECGPFEPETGPYISIYAGN